VDYFRIRAFRIIEPLPDDPSHIGDDDHVRSR
jgi:hypothetical protein